MELSPVLFAAKVRELIQVYALLLPIYTNINILKLIKII